ncbi:MBL fold metallo-hydrolase [Bradyrhizobium vignae]|uniref:Beta-lactamase n=1 Tax=Bradyrhizobium vignae TaxID=1549949 RepID=A0A2U3PUT9_9BRAD|nr:MBL fold metallo-hydrolase [Bradyrhizobium vignae]SPP92931.1 Beta-lactamase [Bradyrhizobium vignae]
MVQQSGIKRWRVGQVTVTRVQEREVPIPAARILSGATPELVLSQDWLRPHFAEDDGSIRLAFNSFIIESDNRRIVVDTCAGNDKQRPGSNFHMLQTGYLDDMISAGFPPEEINTVLCTHMHVDHVGWNTRLESERWVPTFPNARYLFGRKEWAHTQSTPSHWGDVVGDSLQPIIDAGLADIVDETYQITKEVRLEPTPGHTPGHVSVRIRSEGAEALITGDILHHPLQCACPQINCVFDVSPDEAHRTRSRFFAEAAGTPVLVLGSHFANPTGGRIVADGDVYRFVPV